MAARTTSSTTSSGAGAGGSATSSIWTSRAPWKTAALTVSALDLHLHVARGVAGRVEGGRALAQREGGGQERRGVDAARRHEADRPRPHPCRPDDAAHLKGLGLHEPNLDVRAAADVDSDEHDARTVTGEREHARHPGRDARRLDPHVEAASFRQLGRLLGDVARSGVESMSRTDLQPELAT